jgi:hypothetical protein
MKTFNGLTKQVSFVNKTEKFENITLSVSNDTSWEMAKKLLLSFLMAFPNTAWATWKYDDNLASGQVYLSCN